MSRDYIPPSRRKPNARNTRVKPSRKTIPGWLWMVGGVLIGVLVNGIINLGDDDATKAQDTAEQEEAAKKLREEDSPEKGAPAHKPRFDFYTLLKESEVIVPDENGNIPTAKPVVIAEPDKGAADMKDMLEKETEELEDSKVAEATLKPSTDGQQTTPAATETKPAAPQTASVEPVAALETLPAETLPTETLPPETLPKSPPEPAKPQPAPAPPGEVFVLQAGSFKNAADADSVRASLLLLNMHANIEKVTTGTGETWHRVVVGPYRNTTDLGNARALLSQNGIDSIQVKRKQ